MTDQIKVVMLGDTGVGKTCIIQRLIYNKFDPSNNPTIITAMNSITMEIPGAPETIRFQIWDTAGQERYHSMTSFYYKDAAAAVIVFDMTNISSFESVKKWVDEVRSIRSDSITIVIVANKSDYVEKICIDPSEITNYSESVKIPVVISSAKDDVNIKEIFQKVGEILRENSMDKSVEWNRYEYIRDSRRLTVEEAKKEVRKDGCC